MQRSPRPTREDSFHLPPDTLPWAAAAAVALFIVAPLDLSQLVFLGLGAVAYYLMQLAPPLPRRPIHRKTPPSPAGKSRCVAPCTPPAASPAKRRPSTAPARPASLVTARPRTPGAAREGKSSRTGSSCKPAALPAGSCCSTPSVSIQPVLTPIFHSVDFDAQVTELLSRITPTVETESTVKDIARSVAATVREVLPEVEVTGVACGPTVGGGTAFGVAVPEVEVVIDISPGTLAKRVQVGNGPDNSLAGPARAKSEARRLSKIATRVCTDRLVASGGFKFRRSAFRAQEPKVTLIAIGAGDFGGVPFDLSVNCPTPLCNAALLEECGQMETRARGLILLVRRWAKDRGICHAAKGHLPPYAWTLLVIYFLQVGVPDEGPLLPPLEDFARASSLLKTPRHHVQTTKVAAEWKPPACGELQMSVGDLFRAFIDFYSTGVDWRREGVAVHRGRRAVPELVAELHLVIHDDESAEVAPTIQDPFNLRRNVATSLTAEGLVRFREELGRAGALCARGAALSELLEPWSPEASWLARA